MTHAEGGAEQRIVDLAPKRELAVFQRKADPGKRGSTEGWSTFVARSPLRVPGLRRETQSLGRDWIHRLRVRPATPKRSAPGSICSSSRAANPDLAPCARARAARRRRADALGRRNFTHGLCETPYSSGCSHHLCTGNAKAFPGHLAVEGRFTADREFSSRESAGYFSNLIRASRPHASVRSIWYCFNFR
jgi:hypothetical protein